MRGRRLTLLLAVAGAVWLPAAGVRATGAVDELGQPLRVRNAAPASHLYGLPRTLGPVLAAGAELVVGVDHANNFTSEQRPEVRVSFDGSTTVATVGLRSALGRRWEWGAELPVIRHDGGFTDALIDGWHGLFGLPEGGRERALRNEIDYRIDYRGTSRVRIDDATDGVGDGRVWVGYRAHQAPDRAVALRGMVKLATGEADQLTGSGATDLALWLEVADTRTLTGLGVAVSLMAGVSRLGEGDLLPGAQRDWVASGHLGLHYPLVSWLTLRAQLDAHSELIDVDVPELGGGAVLGTLGGSARLGARWRLDFAVVEDLTPRRAPDVVFQVSLGTRF